MTDTDRETLVVIFCTFVEDCIARYRWVSYIGRQIETTTPITNRALVNVPIRVRGTMGEGQRNTEKFIFRNNNNKHQKIIIKTV